MKYNNQRNKISKLDRKSKTPKKSYSKPKIENLGKLKNITMGASLVGIDSLGQRMA